MDMEFSPFAGAQVAEAELLTDEEPDGPDAATARPQPENPAVTMARLYFGADTFGASEPTLRPWREGEAPVLIPMHPSVDPDIKRAAVDPAQIDKDARTPPPAARDSETAPQPAPGTETIAPKGEVTGEGRRPKTPAERLGLAGAARAKHERCLTNAIYFESRGESERGQMAVAQVVLNRAFSGYYPDNVCGVVYQNANRHLACQFTFACDNVRDVVTEPDAWEVAKRIARDSLDGKIWLPEIGKATHYHATYVNPWWVRTMKKHKTLGIHIFYRPTRWGDGAEAPSWGPAASVQPSIAEARL
jgi:spore germination cell wall hydrolase CwlJ-like protein